MESSYGNKRNLDVCLICLSKAPEKKKNYTHAECKNQFCKSCLTKYHKVQTKGMGDAAVGMK